jgi:hypothetical protein
VDENLLQPEMFCNMKTPQDIRRYLGVLQL